MKFVFFALIACLLIPVHTRFHRWVWEDRAEARQSEAARYVLPSEFSRILALGYKGLLADFQFLETMTFYGEKILEEKALSENDWQFIVNSLDAVTDLDPYFVDPYVFAEGVLVWDGGKIGEANRLLEKAVAARPWDWRVLFYLGFNYFYFLGNYEKASDHIMAASKLPGSHAYLPALAARLSYYGGKTKTGVLFLKEMLAESQEPALQKSLKKRLFALEVASSLEEKIELFTKEFNRKPENIEELLEKGYVLEIPEDPYGGDWIILENGRVFSTSRFAEKPKEKN